MHAESPRFARFGFDPEKAWALAARVMNEAGFMLIVADRGGELVGMFAGFVAEHFFSSARYASDIVLYVTPEYRGGTTAVRFIHIFERWAAKSGAAECVPGVSTEVHAERTEQLYERLGYKRSGVIMQKVT